MTVLPWDADILLKITDSLTSVRIQALQLIKDAISNLESQNFHDEIMALLPVLLGTYDFYSDTNSRNAVLDTIDAVARLGSQFMDKIVVFLDKITSSSKVLAVTDYLTLLAWTHRVLTISCELETYSNLEKIIEIQAKLLVLCTADCKSHRLQHRNRVFKSVVSSGKSAVSTAVSTSKSWQNVIQAYLNIIKSSSPDCSLTLAGVVSEAADSLVPLIPAVADFLHKNSSLVLECYTTALLAKIPPSSTSTAIFGSFITKHIDEDSVQNKIAPAMEKAILRSSENSFNVFLPSFFHALSKKIDLSQTVLNTKLFTNIVSGLKSTKESVRSGAVRALKLALLLIKVPEAKVKVTDEIIKTYKATSSVEIKATIISILEYLVPGQASNHVVEGLHGLLAKDQNEVSLSAGVRVFFLHLIKGDVPLSSTYETLVLKGLQEKKPNLRKVWIVELCNILANNGGNSTCDSLISSNSSVLIDTVQEAQNSPRPSVSNRVLIGAYAVLSMGLIVQIPQSVIIGSISGVNEKPAILTDLKVLTKLVSEDIAWGIKALREVDCLSSVSEEFQTKYGDAWTFFATSSEPSHRLEALNSLKLLVSTPLVSELIIRSIYKALSDPESPIPILRFSPLLSVLVTIDNEELRSKNAAALLIAAHDERVRTKGAWIGLCQRSQIDIGKLVENHGHQMVENALSFEHYDKKTIFKAIATLCFINPKVIAPLVTTSLVNLMNPENIDFDDLQIKIWKSTSEEPVVDVLSNKKKVVDKNDKNYETNKWEEELRQELAKKGKVNKKLTREEQNMVTEQLVKEASIRKDVNKKFTSIRSGLILIEQLILSTVHGKEGSESFVDTGASSWYPAAIKSILDLLGSEIFKKSDVWEFLGANAVNVFLELSRLLSPRLGSLKPFVGVATLRIRSIAVPENLKDEPLLDLTGRILYRMKILSDQSPLDPLSLMYALPLLTETLENGIKVARKNASKPVVTSEFIQEDPEEEHLLLAVEIVGAHAEAFEDEAIPRGQILAVLISLLKLPSRAKLAKETLMALSQYISVNALMNDYELLFGGLLTNELFARSAILEALDAEFDLSTDMSYRNEIWIAAHSSDIQTAELAATIWSDNLFQVPQDGPKQLINFFRQTDSELRLAVAKAWADAVRNIGETVSESIELLVNEYHDKKNPPPPTLDRFGLVIKSSSDQKDRWEQRSTVALAVKHLADQLTNPADLERVFKFLVEEEALGDKEPLVRQELQDAGIDIIAAHGQASVEKLIPIFESCLAAKDQGTKAQDRIKQSVIILYGALARHLETTDHRLQEIVDRLIATLDTPSEDVQHAISECIAPLVPTFPHKLNEYFSRLFDKLFNEKNIAKRHGAAYGIAGLVKGCGIKSLGEFGVMRELEDAAEDKKNPVRREGVSFAFECLSLALGKYFEPYVIEALPLILKSLGDQSPEVREATDLAARQIMKNTTSFGVKKLIPVVISNLDDIAWRTKKGSVELLGSMAYLDPTQLSASLSTIVPEIVGVLNDTHKEVRKAADQALKRFGEVIRNPEIQAIVPELIQAIGDPTKYTDAALDKLIQTQFVHYIDGPSLALIIHVIHRGMRDRSAATKKKACQIVGNMAILVDTKDLQPYLGSLVEELEVAMVDPVPATRSTAARALGSLVEKLGEGRFPDLIPRLLDTLQDPSRSGDRLGSAQALSEVICGLGIDKLEELLPTILVNAASPKSHIRAGYMPLLLFLPVCFGSQFSPYLSRIIPPILTGLADTDEDIRDTALRAGRLIVKNYAKKAVDLLLPELELGLSDSNYRIRLSSLELTGDLLFQVTGISGKNELVEDQSEFSGEVRNSLIEVLGEDRRNKVLALLFVCRSDVSGTVRNAAADIWKAIVANTPRTVKEILPTLTQIIVRKLASEDEFQREIAALTLGEMVRRVGANALAQLLPTLQESLYSSDQDAKQGICIALTELIKSSQYEALVEYQDVFVSVVRDTLVDGAPQVREAAAYAFEALQNQLGKVVINEVLPYLLTMLDSGDDSENALLALQDIMATQADVVFPILLPKLLAPPVDTRALASLAAVAGHAVYQRLPSIINTLVDEMKDKPDINVSESPLTQILISVTSDDGARPLITHILSLVKHQDPAKRAVIYSHLQPFFDNTTLDYSMYTADMVSQFILSLGDSSQQVVSGAFAALNALIKHQPKEGLDRLVKPARQSLELAGVRGTDLPGFKLPKGPNAILPIFLHGLMYGNGEQKELAAGGIAEVIDKTPADNLRQFATAMTGPLIRVVGEKVSPDIKAAILQALTLLLTKIPQFLRPFIPQLQRTFVRSLSDKNDNLRSKAVVALATLIGFQPRVDSLVTELVTGAKNAEDAGIKAAMLKGLLAAVTKAGQNMNEASKATIMTLVEDEVQSVSEKAVVSYARLLGALAKIMSSEEATSMLRTKILDNAMVDEKFAILALNSFLKYSPHHIYAEAVLANICEFIIRCSNSTVDYISDNATVAIGKILLLHREKKSPSSEEYSDKFLLPADLIVLFVNQLAVLAASPPSSSPDTRRLALVVIRTVSRFQYDDLIKPYLDTIVPAVFVCVRDPIIPIKLAAEKAFLAVLKLVDDEQMDLFKLWFSESKTYQAANGTQVQPRSISDYTRRVGARLAAVERERVAAGGDEETVYSDRIEDETEVWAVGGVDMS